MARVGCPSTTVVGPKQPFGVRVVGLCRDKPQRVRRALLQGEEWHSHHRLGERRYDNADANDCAGRND